jgi:hypothetical protein
MRSKNGIFIGKRIKILHTKKMGVIEGSIGRPMKWLISILQVILKVVLTGKVRFLGLNVVLIGRKGLRNLKIGNGRGNWYVGVISDDDDEGGEGLEGRGQEYKGILKRRDLHHGKGGGGGGNERTVGKNGFEVQAPQVAGECEDRPWTINLHLVSPMPKAHLDSERMCYEINIVDEDPVGSQA